MEVIITKDRSEASQYVAEMFMNVLALKDRPVLGLATGGTPKGVYGRLIDAYTRGEITFHHALSFNLDEYLGLGKDDEQGYARYMKENLFQFVDFKSENTHIPNGKAPDPEKECARYSDLIHAQGGIDIQLLGIGDNGHIGFNEPAKTFKRHTHIVELDEKTREANARFFDKKDDVPFKAITMGIGEIMQSRRIVLLALGEHKAEIMERFLGTEDIDPELPASILHAHQHVTVVMDEAAAKNYRKGEKHEATD